MKAHAIETGSLVGNKTFWRGEGFSALFRPRENFEFPVLSYVVEHPEGAILIDTGLAAGVHVPWVQRRFAPIPTTGPRDIGAQLRAKQLDPMAVRWVVITHLDWDHVGAVDRFPNADILVHRPEHEFASTFMGRQRYQSKLWPANFNPTLYDLEREPYGSFPSSRILTDRGDVRIVPLAGHSVGQVGVVTETDGPALLFAADHIMRQDWFLEDYAAGRLVGLGQFGRKAAVETSRRLHRFVEERPTVLLPAHDAEAPVRLGAMSTVGI
jgi:glyoxylase-like metal-dependent hydrolase (beta-lactamase superfamily II)